MNIKAANSPMLAWLLTACFNLIPAHPAHPAETPIVNIASDQDPRIRLHKRAEDAPAWAAAYGKEFWRQLHSEIQPNSTAAPNAIATAKPIHLGEIG